MKYLIILSSFILFSCGEGSENPTPVSPVPQPSSPEWLIPSELVLDGGPGKDGIPSVDSPMFSPIADIDFLADESLVVGVIHEGVHKAYPHPILDWHEITNDNIGNRNFALTYCPLTGTGIAWDRDINGTTTTFGVSGKLYNTNLIPYDRATDSYWSQIRMDCVNGPLIDTEINTFPIIETTWATWKKAFPNSLVQNTNTDFSRDYKRYPYGDYRTNDSNIIFPLTTEDTRLPAKERVLGIITKNDKIVFSIELFSEGKIIEANVNGTDVLVIGSKADNYIIAMSKPTTGTYDFIQDQLPYIAQDEDGNKISLSGTMGRPDGTVHVLDRPNAFMGYFFSFGAFYEEIEVYEE